MIDMNAPGFWADYARVMWTGLQQTLFMVSIAMLLTLLIGLPLGVLLVGTEKGRFLEAPWGSRGLGVLINRAITLVVNVGRSVPFIVLMIALIPLTRAVMALITGRPTFVGTGAATVPLTIIAIPFFVRIVEIAIREVRPGLFEAADSLGATRLQLLCHVVLPEAAPSIILGIATTLTSIINFSAMVGVVGGGGLGQVAVTYGQQRYSVIHIIGVIVILFVLVQLIQSALTHLALRWGQPAPRRRASSKEDS